MNNKTLILEDKSQLIFLGGLTGPYLVKIHTFFYFSGPRGLYIEHFL